VFELLVKWLVPFLCGSAVSIAGTFVGTLKKGRKRDKAIEVGLQCLLRAEIIRSFEKYTERRYCPIYAKEALKREYDSYHELGGNDVATGLFKKIMELPEEPSGLEGKK
jgi:hypothetical protein